jgi:hypothetical protein
MVSLRQNGQYFFNRFWRKTCAKKDEFLATIMAICRKIIFWGKKLNDL